jgi:hypothetical protein
VTTQKPEQVKAGRVELVRRLTALAPKQRLDAMLEEVDGKALVRSVPAEDVYAAIVDVGLADAPEVVQLASPEQFRTFVNLAAWSRDRMDPREVLRWLAAARGDDDDSFISKVKLLDLEILELIFKQVAVIHDLEENPDPHVEGIPVESPEGRFLVELVGIEGTELASMRRLIHDLVTDDAFQFGRLLEAVRWELPTELEETAHQFRSARLEDLGFPPLDEAAKLFAWVDPASVAPKGAPASTALTSQSLPSGAIFVESAFRGLDAHERSVMEQEVRYLVNSALVAEGAEPGDPHALRRVSEQARDWLNLGLEHLSGGEPERAADAVRDNTLKRVFQIGFSLTLQLKRQAEKLLAEPNARFGETWLAMDQETAALQALLRKRPMKALKVSGAEPVPFRFKRELAEMEAMFARVRLQRQIFNALLGPSPAEVVARFGVKLSELTAQRLLGAAVAWAEADGSLEVKPFARGRLVELCGRLFVGALGSEALSASAGQRAQTVLGGDAAEVKTMVDRVLASWLADFGRGWVRETRVDAAKILTLLVEGEIPV